MYTYYALNTFNHRVYGWAKAPTDHDPATLALVATMLPGRDPKHERIEVERSARP